MAKQEVFTPFCIKRRYTWHNRRYTRQTTDIHGISQDIHGKKEIHMAEICIIGDIHGNFTRKQRYTRQIMGITLFLGPLTFQNHWGFSRKSTETYAIWGYYRFSHEIMGLLALFSLYSRAFFVEKLLHFGNGVLFS